MAHHLAELLVESRIADADKRGAAEDRAAALTLRLWAHRHVAPPRLNPLTEYAKAAQVLAAIHPTTHRFAPLNLPGTPTRTVLSLEVFDLASRLAVLGLVELLPELPPKVATAVEKFLSADEADFLLAARRTYDLLGTAAATATTRRVKTVATGPSEVESARLKLLERLHGVVGTLLDSPAADRRTDAGVAAPRRARAKRSR
jgi:hypothetical protein